MLHPIEKRLLGVLRSLANPSKRELRTLAFLEHANACTRCAGKAGACTVGLRLLGLNTVMGKTG